MNKTSISLKKLYKRLIFSNNIYIFVIYKDKQERNNPQNNDMTTLLLVRHGETVDNVHQIMQGQTQGELTPNGIEQARALAAELKDTPIDVFVSSDLKRAFDTCVILAAAHGVAPDAIVQTKLLRERDWGSFTGRYIPDLKDAVWTDDIESLDALRARAASFLQFVRENYDGKTVLAVGHGIMNKAIRSVHSGTPMNETPRMANAEVVRLEVISN